MDTPQYAAEGKTGAAVTPTTADVSTTAPTHTTTVVAAGTDGTKIEQVRITQIKSTAAAGIVNLFLWDGTKHYLLDYVRYGVSTLTATVQPAVVDLYFAALCLETGWELRVTNTVASGSGTVADTHAALAFAGDF